jgi:hypothetical protein
MLVLSHGRRKGKKQNALTFDTSQTFAIISAVSEARFNSEEYMAAGLASLDIQQQGMLSTHAYITYMRANKG